MYELLLAIVILTTGQVGTYRHVDQFPTLEACQAAIQRDVEGDLRPNLVRDYGEAGFSLAAECRKIETSASAEDRAADEIQRVLRAMNAQGGIAAAGR